MTVPTSQIAGKQQCVQQYDQANNKKHQSITSLALCEGNPLVLGGYSSRRAGIAKSVFSAWHYHIDGLMQERRNSSALAMELLLSCTNPSIWWYEWVICTKTECSFRTSQALFPSQSSLPSINNVLLSSESPWTPKLNHITHKGANVGLLARFNTW